MIINYDKDYTTFKLHNYSKNILQSVKIIRSEPYEREKKQCMPERKGHFSFSFFLNYCKASYLRNPIFSVVKSADPDVLTKVISHFEN